jgi:hypothetical protein
MPLVRISLLRGKADGRKAGEVVSRRDEKGVLQAPRRGPAARVRHARPQDVFASLVEVKEENWSFGNGIAQYAA